MSKKKDALLDKDPVMVYHKSSSEDTVFGRQLRHKCPDGITRVIHACYIRVLMCYRNTGYMKIAKRSWTRIGTYCPYCGYISNQQFKPKSQSKEIHNVKKS